MSDGGAEYPIASLERFLGTLPAVADPLPERFYAPVIAALAACFHEVQFSGRDFDRYAKASREALVVFTRHIRPYLEQPSVGLEAPLGELMGPAAKRAAVEALTGPFRAISSLLSSTRERASRYDTSHFWYRQELDEKERQRQDKEDERARDGLIEAIGYDEYAAYQAFNRTPFQPHSQEIFDLFRETVPVPLDAADRAAHQVIVATTDHGKTSLLERMILADLSQPDPPGMVVIDSKGDMVQRLSRLALFDPEHGRLRDRLLIVDPRDAPALNFFDLKAADADTAHRIVTELGYFFRSLMESEVSGTMSGVFDPIAQLLMHVEGANLTTVMDAVDDIDKFKPYFDRLPASARRLFELDFKETLGKETKNAVKRRIYNILTRSPSFDAMFNARRNALDLYAALNAGAIVLVSTEANYLREFSPIFGRYMIFQTISAALQRANDRVRRPAYLYVDEAGPYIDEKCEELFSTLRSYGLAAIMAFQHFGQIPAAYQRTIMANTGVKMVGGGSMEDARTFAADMRTTSEFIFDQTRDNRRPPRFTRYAMFVRNAALATALSVTVPIGELDREPQMSPEAYGQLRARNRQALADLPAPPEPARSEAAARSAPARPVVLPRAVARKKRLPEDEDDAATDWPSHE